jgi:hypothetical protein
MLFAKNFYLHNLKKLAVAGWLFLFALANCNKKSSTATTPPPVDEIYITQLTIDNKSFSDNQMNVDVQPTIRTAFSKAVLTSSVSGAVKIADALGNAVNTTISLQNHDSVILVRPSSPLNYLSKYNFQISTALKSSTNGNFTSPVNQNFITKMDSSDKFPIISDDSLLTLVQKQNFKYFWDFAHPVSGMARERNTSGETVTTGGSGLGVMSIIAAINRNFITRADGLQRVQKIVSFLKNMAPKFHGAFSHWMNGTTGAVVPFAQNDDGADLVETSYMMMGLLTARQYFNGADPAEINLTNDINLLWNGVEWDWFRQNGKKVLYWNWSPTSQWAVNVPVQGWNEALITYVLAASSTTHGIPKPVYDSGFARNGAMRNNNSFYGYVLPLGPAYGGPLFFAHYSFLGINPNGLIDAYANYQTQTVNHTKINYEYCKADPQHYYGYSNQCWGLTACDIPNGYSACSPTNDLGVIAPTAISSLPYTPTESMNALKFFYYKLGDKIWGQYGFVDAFSLHMLWFATSYLAIDQGPMIVMIENYRSGLLWNLFTSCPEVKNGMLSLGFSAPYL